jgi:hypothetical protein
MYMYLLGLLYCNGVCKRSRVCGFYARPWQPGPSGIWIGNCRIKVVPHEVLFMQLIRKKMHRPDKTECAAFMHCHASQNLLKSGLIIAE